VLVQENIDTLTRASSHFAVTAMEQPKGLVQGTLQEFVDASEVACGAFL
jgi:response regulator of citrate/malate metabolism